MIPSNLTDDELLHHYDELFRQHPATAELAERMTGGSAARALESDIEDVRAELSSAEDECVELREERDALAEALEDFLDDTSAVNAAAARKVLDGLK